MLKSCDNKIFLFEERMARTRSEGGCALKYFPENCFC